MRTIIRHFYHFGHSIYELAVVIATNVPIAGTTINTSPSLALAACILAPPEHHKASSKYLHRLS